MMKSTPGSLYSGAKPEDNIKILRPSGGLEPKEYEKLLSQTAKMNIKFGTAMNYGLVEK